MKLVLVIWGYFSEALLATLLTLLTLTIFELSEISTFLKENSSKSLLPILIMIFAASTAFFWSFSSQGNTEFYIYLQWKKALYVYKTSFITTILIHLTAIILLSFLQSSKSQASIILLVFFLILSIISFITLLKNASELTALQTKFNTLIEQTRKHENINDSSD